MIMLQATILMHNIVGKEDEERRKKGMFLLFEFRLGSLFTTVFAYAKRELRNEWRFEAILPSFLQSIRCKQKAFDRWLADLHVTLLSVLRCGLLRPMTDHCTLGADGFVLMGM